jgi:hypothetical protein
LASTATISSPFWKPAFSAGLPLGYADDERQAIVGRVDADADAHVFAGQVARPVRPLLGGHERGVAGIADRLGHAVDGAVDEILVVERVGADVLGVKDVPGLADEAEIGGCGGARSRGRRSGPTQGGQVQTSDPDPDAQRQHQRETDGGATEIRTASTAGRR